MISCAYNQLSVYYIIIVAWYMVKWCRLYCISYIA